MNGIRPDGRTVVPPSEPDEAAVPFSPAVRAGNWVFVSAQYAADAVGTSPGRQGAFPFYADPLATQSVAVYRHLERLMAASGGTLDDLVRITQWFPVPDDWRFRSEWGGLSITRYLEERDRHITHDRPASIGLGVRALPVVGSALAVDVVGRLPSGGEQKQSVYLSAEKHQVLAGYSPAIRMGDWIFCSGEVPTDWRGDWGATASYGTPSSVAVEARVNAYQWLDFPIRRQTQYVLQKLAETAEAAATSLQHAVKATVYLLDPADFYGFEEVWRSWFPTDPPARVVIPHAGLGPVGARVEIALDLLSPEAAARRQVIQTTRAPEPITHEPQAIRVDDLVFLSGQMAHDGQGFASGARVNPVLPYYESAPKRELRYMLDNVQAICEAAGSSLSNLVRVQQLATDLSRLPGYLEVWRERFPSDPPAGLSCEVASPLLVPECSLLLDLIAFVPNHE
jgi:enamine deaminase RidA (YjgF/YER057c/UK114 family)